MTIAHMLCQCLRDEDEKRGKAADNFRVGITAVLFPKFHTQTTGIGLDHRLVRRDVGDFRCRLIIR